MKLNENNMLDDWSFRLVQNIVGLRAYSVMGNVEQMRISVGRAYYFFSLYTVLIFFVTVYYT